MPDPIVEAPAPVPKTPPEIKDFDAAKVTESLIAKHGSAESVARELVGENYKARERARIAEEKLPPDGAVILIGDDARAWEAYRSVGKPEDVRRIKTERDQFATENGTLKRSEELRSVADAAKVSLAVLKTIAGERSFEVKPVKDIQTGKDVPTVFVKDGDAEAVEFDDFAAKHWVDFLPALRPNTTEPIGTPRIGDSPQRQQQIEQPKRRQLPLVR